MPESSAEKRGITEWRFKRLDWRFKKMIGDQLEIALVIRPIGEKNPKEVVLRTVPFNIVSHIFYFFCFGFVIKMNDF